MFDTFDLRLVGLGADDTVAMFREAYGNLCEWYGHPRRAFEDDEIVRWRRRAEAHAIPLMVVAAALHAVLEPQDALGLIGPQVVGSLVKRERDRLDTLGEETARLMGFGPPHVEPAWASRLYGMPAATSRGIDAAMPRALARPELEFSLPDADRVVDLARRLPVYENDATSPHITIPRPDVFGAALLHRVLSERADMAPEWVWATIREPGPAAPSGDLADRLGRLIYDVGTVLQEPCLTEWLLRMIAGDRARARFLPPLGSEDRPPDAVLPFTIEINRALVPETDGEPLVDAQRLTQLALHLSRADRDAEAVEPARLAVGIARNADREQGDAPKVLARALRVLAMALCDVTDASEAVDHASEAVSIYRARVAAGRASTDELADALNTLGFALTNAGRTVEALGVLQEPVDTYRARIDANHAPESRAMLLDNLARALFNLSGDHWASGQRERALQAIEESVTIRRHLHAETPWRYGRSFALSLGRLASYLGESRDHDRASRAIDEAIGIRKQLAGANPGQFGIELVESLSTKASTLLAAGRKDDSMRTTEEETQALFELLENGTLIADTPTLEALTLKLAGVLGYTAVEAGNPAAALAACGKAVEILERVRDEKPSLWGPGLQLRLLAAYLNRGNAHSKDPAGVRHAIADYSVAIDHARALAARDDAEPAWSVHLEVALLNRCLERLVIGDVEKARDDYTAAVEVEQDLRTTTSGSDWPMREHLQVLKSLNVLIGRLASRNVTPWIAEVAEGVVQIVSAMVASPGFDDRIRDVEMMAAKALLGAGMALYAADDRVRAVSSTSSPPFRNEPFRNERGNLWMRMALASLLLVNFWMLPGVAQAVLPTPGVENANGSGFAYAGTVNPTGVPPVRASAHRHGSGERHDHARARRRDGRGRARWNPRRRSLWPRPRPALHGRHGPGCAGQTIPPRITKALAHATELLEQEGDSIPRRARRLLKHARHSLTMAEHAVKRDARGKKQKLTAACSADVERAIENARGETGS